MDVTPGALAHRRLMASLWFLWALILAWLSMRTADAALSQALRGAPEAVHRLFRAVTDAGLGKWSIWPSLLGAGGLVLYARREPDAECARWLRGLAWALAFIGLAVMLSGLVTDLIKVGVGRGRPKLLDQMDFFGFVTIGWRSDYQSFPSGHATTSAALALAVSWLVPRLWAPALLFAIVIAVSRVVLNAHFLGDVVGGAAVGCFVTWWLREWYAARGILFTYCRDGSVRWVGLKPERAAPET